MVLKQLARIVYVAICFLTHTAYAVTWEEQAERLQLVSATLLDAVPFTNPVTSSFSLQIQLPLSVLPKVDPTVGGKSEKVPASPVHTVPTLKISAFVGRSNLFDLGVQLWGGYLLPGAEKIVGIKAALLELAAGGAIVPSKNIGNVSIYIAFGGQLSQSELKGGITASDAHDEFTAKTTLLFVSPGFYSPATRTWGGLTIGQKTTESRFEIPADDTVFELTDTLSDSKFPYFIQANFGYNHPSGVQVAIGELWVPNRLLIPRLLVGYEVFQSQ